MKIQNFDNCVSIESDYKELKKFIFHIHNIIISNEAMKILKFLLFSVGNEKYQKDFSNLVQIAETFFRFQFKNESNKFLQKKVIGSILELKDLNIVEIDVENGILKNIKINSEDKWKKDLKACRKENPIFNNR